MKISRILAFVNETSDITTLPSTTTSQTTSSISKTSTLGATDKKGGKSLDGIAAGTSTPYKEVNSPQETPFDKQYKALKNLVDKTKRTALNGAKILDADALNDLNSLISLGSLSEDEDGDLILPFGAKTRIRQDGDSFYMFQKSED